MRRITITLALTALVVACTAEADPTTSVAPTTTSTTTSTTIPPTTTTLLPVEGQNADPELIALVRALYELPAGAGSIAAPAPVIEALSAAEEPTVPSTAEAHVGIVEEGPRIAVVEAGKDVTLAVADPEWRVVGGWSPPGWGYWRRARRCQFGPCPFWPCPFAASPSARRVVEAEGPPPSCDALATPSA